MSSKSRTWGAITRVQRAWLTPDATAGDEICRPLFIPTGNLGLVAAVAGALSLLGEEKNWQQLGDMTPEECAQAMRDMLLRWYDEPCGTGETAPTPYWEDDVDVDDSAPSELQQWFGFVTEPNAPPGELDFVEDMTIWGFTGFVMSAFGPGAALFFKANFPRFYITVRDTNIVELIRIIVDGVEVKQVTTPGTNSGEINVPVVADPAIATGHDIYIIKAG